MVNRIGSKGIVQMKGKTAAIYIQIDGPVKNSAEAPAAERGERQRMHVF
jgi:hypothetical protein